MKSAQELANDIDQLLARREAIAQRLLADPEWGNVHALLGIELGNLGHRTGGDPAAWIALADALQGATVMPESIGEAIGLGILQIGGRA